MILFPAIDMKDGAVVRLYKGDLDKVTHFGNNPLEQAQAFETQGFSWLHMVDLNGATKGRSVNNKPVQNIIKDSRLKIQLGGGIRDLTSIEHWLKAGVTRVILGTAAAKNPTLVHEACREFAGRIVVGIDARNGKVALEGWLEQSQINYIELAQRYEDAGVTAIIFTDISRDGALSGINIEATEKLAKAVALPIIASGGVSGLGDLLALKHSPQHFEGVIAGRALYDGRLDPKAALELFSC